MNDADLPELNPETYVKETALALWECLPKVLLGGLLFSLVALPGGLLYLLGFSLAGLLLGALGAGPGLLALCALLARALLREPASFVEFWKAFGRFFGRGALLGVLAAVPLLAASLTLPALQISPVPALVWLGLGADLAGLLFLALLYLYAAPQIVLYDLKVGTALRNSLLLNARHLGNSLGLLGMAALLALLASSVSYLLWAILPACWLVFVINNCRMVIRQETHPAA